MILGDLLGSPVLDPDGERLGFAVDLRFVLNPSPEDKRTPEIEARVHGVIVSPHTRSSFLGYDRSDVNAPALIARFLAWRHRGSFLILWPDVERFKAGSVELRRGYRKYDPGFRIK